MSKATINNGDSGATVRSALNANFTELYTASNISGLAIDLPSVISHVLLCEANRLAPVADAIAVSTWTDASGNANNATQTGGNRPVYKIAANGINNQPVLRFAAASSQYMQTVAGSASLTSSWYAYALVKFISLTGYQTILAWGQETTGKRREMLKITSAGVTFNGYSADLPDTDADGHLSVELLRTDGITPTGSQWEVDARALKLHKVFTLTAATFDIGTLL